ncbi:hypothetical protein EJ05DRAFT_529073 [Pseudovirgaria hyperparasitica]|uniref:Uncharacterized protein n=1 Tax=Pseudovirgaria hyperparasitica TaxID=470096 RepID=A0A6A6W5Q8_9PEZI|nr:uncharacterized protein EJ05DRAFT_529073 [Pseudovirgaria hyperparasitica]KAF2757364.1 hypothetical protein EJ05DRAFT_529073 [Pseudovirgaria hyperparasitica]
MVGPQLPNVSRAGSPQFFNDSHDRDAHDQYISSLQQRQQQADAFYRTQHYSRPSSSSGSLPQSLRRTPRPEPRPVTRRRSGSLDSAVRAKPAGHLTEEPAPNESRPRAASANRAPTPHPALHISRRTASAILYTLEEAIRTPHPFTPDLVEENAPMSDLPGGAAGSARAANNGARAASGPVPVQQRSGAAGVRTPRDIMNERQAREARRREQEDTARQAEQREQQQAQDDETRRAAERRIIAAGVAAPYQRDTGRSRQTGDGGYVIGEQPRQQPGRQEIPTTGRPPGGDGVTGSRTRASSLSQGQPRVAVPQQSPAQAGSSRVPGAVPRLPTSSAPLQPHARTSSAPAQSIPKPSVDPSQPQPQSQTRTSNVSSFPHAFERWETLSSHWEGLTSYWIRRLEANTEEVRREPLAQQMSRQITDLSAAGANLFHAVVELQRLRASSERKFQRWFFETRQEQERMQEVQAELERSLAAERTARKDAELRAERAERDKNVDSKKTSEIRRELQISVEEARRAWEELGRREQEERDRTMSLREGHPTLVGGVQVVPMQATMSRHGSTSQRPSTQERLAEQDPQMRQQFSYDDQSPTDTDPYASAAARGATSALRNEPEAPAMGQSGYATYPSGSTPATSSSTHTMIPTEQTTAPRTQIPTSQAQQQPSRVAAPPVSEPSTPEAFYTHAGTYLTTTQSGQPSTSQQSQPQQSQQYQRQTTAVSEPGDDGQSYVPSVEGESEISDEEEYVIDADGNYVRDQRGNPIPYRPPRRSIDSDADSYDVQADLDRERELAQRYGSQPSQRYPATTGTAGPPVSSAGGTGQPDYEGQGYGQGSYEWAGVQRHHHPTRLSDVLEEDERSRTSPSRGSQRGQFAGGLG